MKKLLAALAALLLSVPCAAAAAQTPYLRGDADGSGIVDIMDVTAIQLVIAELDSDSGVSLRGDIDGNGLDINDATNIQRYIAGCPDSFGVGEVVEPTQPETERGETPEHEL